MAAPNVSYAEDHINTGDVLVGVSTLWYAPYGASGAEPLPADTVPFGSAWAGNWVYPGATEGGVVFSWTPKTQDILVDEQATPALVTPDTVDVEITTTLMEDTLNNMILAYGMGVVTSTPAGTGGEPAKDDLALTFELNQISVGLEGLNSYGAARRIYIPRAISGTAKVDTTYQRAKTARMYAVAIRALCPTGSIHVIDYH